MTTNTNRFSTYTNASVGSGADSKDGKNGAADKKDLWSSMLDSVASAKRLPEKNLLVLGGSVDSQREFLGSLSSRSEASQRAHDRSLKKPPVANQFALGYTYYDVLDADQEDTLARISLYTLATPSPAFSELLTPLLTPQSIPNTVIVVLLDWSEPWTWMRQLREWILLLRTVLVKLSNEAKETMQEVMISWRERGRGGGINLDGTINAAAAEGDVALPLGPGEWQDALGLPLCLVCQNAENMEFLEKTHGWKEEEFDMVLQFMRTVLLRHGASLIYTTPNTPSQLPTLVHSSLGIHSLLKKQPLKHNVIDRDKIVVPPNWDSWGKIRVLREGFDVETVSEGWAIDLDQPFPPPQSNGAVNGESSNDTSKNGPTQQIDPQGSTVILYEDSVQDPSMDALQVAQRNTHSTSLEVETRHTQAFLEEQYKLLEEYRKKHSDEEAKREQALPQRYASSANAAGKTPTGEDSGTVNEHIGPVQFNMGGIQVDADDMLQRLKDRQARSPSGEDSPEETVAEEVPPMDTENLQTFFSNLMKRGTHSK